MRSTERAAPYTDTPAPRRPSQSSESKAPAWVPAQDPGLALRTMPRASHELQQQAAGPSTNTDSGHSSQSSPSSPSSSATRKESSLAPLSSLPPLPLSASKPRRPRSQQPAKPRPLSAALHPGHTEVQVYRVEDVTYVDLDPKAFMRPENRVLPTSDLVNNSKTAYAKINVSKSMIV